MPWTDTENVGARRCRLRTRSRTLGIALALVIASTSVRTWAAPAKNRYRWTIWAEVQRLWHRLRVPPVQVDRSPAAWTTWVLWEGVRHWLLNPWLGHGHLHQVLAAGVAELTGTHSLGAASCGSLHEPRELPADPEAYHLRHTSRVFATPHAVTHLRRAIATVRRARSDVDPLAVGDLSLPRGGSLPGHRSHRSGRDVDLGFYFLERPDRYPEDFVHASPENLDREATWLLITALAASRKRPGGARYVLLDWRLQRLLFEWARDNGISKRKLEDILQYPRPEETPEGFVRHFDGHHDHMHVRFACPPGEFLCLQ